MDHDTGIDTRSKNPPAKKHQRGTITAATRTALAKALNGRSSRQLGDEKANLALDHIYRHGWSTASIIAEMQETGKNAGLAKRLKKNGWLKGQPLVAVSRHKKIPVEILALTPPGRADVVWRHRHNPITPEPPDESGFSVKDAVHDLVMQRLTLMYTQRIPFSFADEEFFPEIGKVDGYVTAHQLGEDINGRKRPDAIWKYDRTSNSGMLGGMHGTRVAVELELSPKTGRRFDQFLAGHIAMQRNGLLGPIDAVVIFMTSPESAERYIEAMRPGEKVKRWIKTSKFSNWEPDRGSELVVPTDFKSFVVLIDDV